MQRYHPTNGIDTLRDMLLVIVLLFFLPYSLAVTTAYSPRLVLRSIGCRRSLCYAFTGSISFGTPLSVLPPLSIMSLAYYSFLVFLTTRQPADILPLSSSLLYKRALR